MAMEEADAREAAEKRRISLQDVRTTPLPLRRCFCFPTTSEACVDPRPIAPFLGEGECAGSEGRV
eukprot:scaffold238740_cov31-Tisochrysis_lutea.AAC.3